MGARAGRFEFVLTAVDCAGEALQGARFARSVTRWVGGSTLANQPGSAPR